MLARQEKKAELEAANDAKVTPVAPFKAMPQKNPDWATLQGEVTAQFSQTIAYLAK